ncbi:MAG TPA: hypothetical protein VMF55_09595 [Solirubrobacterales bacterium]|nr:hypothetical protein [Solirubrobacterales bacterium]
MSKSRSNTALLALAALLALLIAGCGGGGSSTVDDGSETAPSIALEPGLVDWPYFGRIPQRTHYLPTTQGSIDRPLDPGYTPVIADGRRLIAVGYFTVIGLEPTKP